jgi:translation initiation factor 1
MSKKNKHKNREGVVFSTNPEFNFFENISGLQATLPNERQNLIVKIDKKKRGGKVVTLVQGFVGSPDDLKDLGKMIKTKCGVGGSQKDGEIIIQGDFKEKTYQLLLENKYKVKKSG